MAGANLLITYDPAHVKKAQDEAKVLLKQVGETAKLIPSKVEGILLVQTKKKPRELIKKLLKIGKKDFFNYTYHWTPIDLWVKTDLKSLSKALKALDKKMDPSKSWKLEVTKRYYDKMSAMELTLKLTENITKPKVDLEAPDVVINVEVLGAKTGLSILASDETMDTQKLK